MNLSLQSLESQVGRRLAADAWPWAAEIAWACTWLEACSYPGLKMLLEARAVVPPTLELKRSALGLDLGNISCAVLAPGVVQEVKSNGRVFLRNVKHGLYLLPFSVREDIGIGCPVDPGFALGGARSKNPYADKLGMAASAGIDVDAAVWHAFLAPET